MMNTATSEDHLGAKDSGPEHSSTSKALHLCGIFVFVILLAGSFVLFGLTNTELKNGLDSLKLCNSKGMFYENWANSYLPVDYSAWFYNMTDIEAYVAGGNATMVEVGPVTFNSKRYRGNVRFLSDDQVFYDQWKEYEYDSKQSKLSLDTSIWNIDPAYLTLMGTVRHEGLMLLSAMCTTAQIAKITDLTVSTCSAATRNTATICRCCDYTTSGTSTSCSSLLSSTASTPLFVSWLSQNDGGYQLGTTNTYFPLSKGPHSSLIASTTVAEVLFGRPQSLIGFFSTVSAISTADYTTLYKNANLTSDMANACFRNHCPSPTTVNSVLASLSTVAAVLTYLGTISCSGTIDSPQVMMTNTSGGAYRMANGDWMTESDATDLAYLEGVSCKPFTTTYVAWLLLNKYTSTYSCVNTGIGTAYPCCLQSATSSQATLTFLKGGLGCLAWKPGTLQARRVYDADSSAFYLGSNVITTGCNGNSSFGEDGSKFQVVEQQGISSVKTWYTPGTYTAPQAKTMRWADPTNWAVFKASSALQASVSQSISGYYGGQYPARWKITAPFGSRELGKGPDPFASNFVLYSAPDLASYNMMYLGASKHDQFTCARYSSLASYSSFQDSYASSTLMSSLPSGLLSNSTQVKWLQKMGQIPFVGLRNGLYGRSGIPLMTSSPNYLGVDASVLTQVNSVDEYLSSSYGTSGVQLYRSTNGYKFPSISGLVWDDSMMLSENELITEDNQYAYQDDLDIWLDVEPVTGLVLASQTSIQTSAFLWNCNPSLDSTCALLASTSGHCYRSGVVGYPCSALNVFTPAIVGEKVLPVVIVRSVTGTKNLGTPYDTLRTLSTLKLASDIIVVIIPILSFIGLLMLIFSFLNPGSGKVADAKIVEAV